MSVGYWMTRPKVFASDGEQTLQFDFIGAHQEMENLLHFVWLVPHISQHDQSRLARCLQRK